VTTDRVIAALAERQGGVVGRGQLLVRGITARSIDRRIAAGRLHIVRRGVYAVGHRVLGAVGRRWAAVLTCGDGAVLSDASAADAWGLRATASAQLHVTVPGGVRIRQPGLVVHRRSLPADERTTLDGLPITTPQRTLLDLAAAGIEQRALEAAFQHAESALRIDWAVMQRLLERHAGRPGVPLVRATLARYQPADTRSELEAIVLALCAEHGIPRPQVNVVVEGKVRDFYWPHADLVVEADSYTWHHSPTALNDDRERDVQLTLAGVRFLRFTYEQCTQRPGYVRRAILASLGGHLTTHNVVQ
jgi:very-short-patch-repair endonuclease